MAIRDNISNLDEVKDIIIADIVLVLAFSSTIAGGLPGFGNSPSTFVKTFATFLPVAALGVTLSFVLHELMHKFAAQHYGAVAGFRTSYTGLLITLATGAFGFLLGIPGATVIYSSRFTRKESGVVSLVGPLTNLAVFGVFLVLLQVLNPAKNTYTYNALTFTLFISILLAFFNMLPIPPLDGSKVLAWNKFAYFSALGTIFLLMVLFTGIGIGTVLFFIAMALFFSFFYRLAL